MGRFFGRLSLWMFLAITLCVGGCGDSSDSSQDETPAEVVENVPLSEINTIYTGAGEVLFSWLIESVEHGIQAGFGHFVVENTLGRLFDYIINGGEDEEAEKLDEMNSTLESMEAELRLISSELANLANQLQMTETTIVNYITTTQLQDYISSIEALYSANNQTGLMGIANLVQLGSVDQATLQQYVTNYVALNDGKMENYIVRIHGLICPQVSAVPQGVLRNFADHILQNMPPAATGTDGEVLKGNAEAAMAAYQLLEAFFSQIIIYQTEALTVATEISNQLDPTGATASAYMNGTLKPDGTYNLTGSYRQLLTDEIDEFMQTVKYLMVNTIDYRTAAKFRIDLPFMSTQGLAPDVTYASVYARSRFFAAQLMRPFVPDTENADNFGLVASVVIPKNYSPGTMSPVTTMTLELTGPQEGNPDTYTKTLTATNIPGRFPYTQWNHATTECSPDNNWSFYDLNDVADDLPAGTYAIRLVENPDGTMPWVSASTNLGTVAIKYYDPTTFDPSTATTTATDTNTIKFGSTSGRWDWGYSRLSGSPASEWDLTDPPAYLVQEEYVTVSPTTESPSAILNSVDVQLSPYKLKFDWYNWQGAAYYISLPYKVTGAPGDEPGGIASAALYADIGGSYQVKTTTSAPKSAYHISEELWILTAGHMVQWFANDANNGSGEFSGNGWDDKTGDYTFPQNGISSVQYTAGAGQGFEIGGELLGQTGMFYTPTLQGSLNFHWNAQIVYTNTYNVYQQ